MTTCNIDTNGVATLPPRATRHRKTGVSRVEVSELHRALSRPHNSEQEIRLFELFFHIPGFAELQRLRVHRALSLVSLQAMLQREFAVLFEDQQLYFQGELLEGDEDLPFYGLDDQSVINVRISKRYRRIGDVFSTIRVIRFPTVDIAASPPSLVLSSGATGSSSRAAQTTMHFPPEDYALVEVVAPLPPLRVVLRRLGIVIAYITMLDRMQQKRTNRRVWYPHASTSGGEAVTALDAANTPTRRHPRSYTQGDDAVDAPAAATSFIMRKCSPECVSRRQSITLALHKRLQVSPDARSAADVRSIHKWLGSVKYFASANIPEQACAEIARYCVYERYAAGDFIFRQGDLGEHFYIVLSGSVALAAYGNGYFGTMAPGACFGELSLFEANGVRTASANVNFTAPFAELAVLAGDVYRRAINPFKQAVLRRMETAVYSVPQLRPLPDHTLTHIAYAGKSLTAKTGKRLIRHGDALRVLVLLVAGEVKVSTPRIAQRHTRPTCTHSSNSSTSAWLQAHHHPCDNSDSRNDQRSYPLLSVVCAPAVFGQESCLSNTPTPAPWDVDALEMCTLICLRMDTISIFLAPQHDIVRALSAEHERRIDDFRRRVGQIARIDSNTTNNTSGASPPQRRRSIESVQQGRRASCVRLLAPSSQRLPVDMDATPANVSSQAFSSSSPRQRAATRVVFPQVLLRDSDDAMAAASPRCIDVQSPRAPTSPSRKEATRGPLSPRGGGSACFVRPREASRPRSSSLERESEQQPHEPIAAARSPRRAQTAPSCAESHDRLLHAALPFGSMLTLQEQITFVSFEQQQREWDHRQQQQRRQRDTTMQSPIDTDDKEHERAETTTQALLRGLRQLHPQDVELVGPSPATAVHAPPQQQQPLAHFCFAPAATPAAT